MSSTRYRAPNSALCRDRRGYPAGIYRKTHSSVRSEGLRRRDDLLVVDLGGVKTVVMICFDVEFLEAARALAGADLPVTVSANMAPLGRDHGVFATAHALEHGPPHSYVNQVGRGEAFTFAGGTMAVSAHGDRPVGAGVSGETVVRLRLDTAVGNPVRPEESKLNYLK